MCISQINFLLLFVNIYKVFLYTCKGWIGVDSLVILLEQNKILSEHIKT